MSKKGHNSNARLVQLAQSINTAEDEIIAAREKHIAPVREHIKDIYTTAAAEGFDKKSLREVVRRSRLPTETRDTAELYAENIMAQLLG